VSFATLANNTRYAFGENRLTLIAVAMLAVMAVCATLGPALAPYDPL
jgi:peptide/nickel transport system permease protein